MEAIKEFFKKIKITFTLLFSRDGGKELQRLFFGGQKFEGLEKHRKNPIISPTDNHWESWQTFNPGVVYIDGRFHFLYRAIGSDGLSRFGYASSPDGFVKQQLAWGV